MKKHFNFRQIIILTKANLKSRYRNSISGFLWVVLNPVLLFGAQSYAFHVVLKIDVKNYVLFLASGLLPWIFLNQTLDMGTGLFVSSGRLLKSFPMPPLTLLLALTLDNLINFAAAFLVILIPVGLYFNFNFLNLIVLPIPLLFLMIATLSLCWILATLNVMFRDIKFIITFVMAVSFYLTPIFYPISFIDERFRWIANYNIFYLLILPFREMIEGPFQIGFLHSCMKAAAVSLSLFVLAVLVWRSKRNAVYNYL